MKQRLLFTSRNCTRLVSTLDRWQSRKLQIQHVFNDLNDLMNSLRSLESGSGESADEQLGPKSACEKLCQYTTVKKQPAINLLRDIRILDPIHLASLTVDYDTIKASLLLPNTCDEEWPIYVGLAKDASPSNILQFNNNNNKRL